MSSERKSGLAAAGDEPASDTGASPHSRATLRERPATCGTTATADVEAAASEQHDRHTTSKPRSSERSAMAMAMAVTERSDAGTPDNGVTPVVADSLDAVGATAVTAKPDAASPDVGAQPAKSGVVLPERYEDVRRLGSGGFAEVRLVRDTRLGRTVAMKILRPEVSYDASLRARFLAEIKLTAGLHHPGIVAVHDYGELVDGRLWFTMAEVRGRTLRAVLQQASGEGRETSRRRLLDVFARVCEAVAYAHSRGTVHRDLKPDNIMVGDFGRVLVMDWGIARRLVAEQQAAERASAQAAAQPLYESVDDLTQRGTILGTPAFMAPEQARGEIDKLGPRTDVYALGAILFLLLSGRPPYEGRPRQILAQVATHPPPLLPDGAAPPELTELCARAMARAPQDRFADAGELAAEMTAFLDGARRRERALAELAKAETDVPAIAELHERAHTLRTEAEELLGPLKPYEPVERKLDGWAREDEAEQLDREAALRETHWLQQIHGALAIEPELPEAHMALANHYKDKLIEAERAQRLANAARYEVLLRSHARGAHAAFLSGNGALSLVTDPAGAQVTLYRYKVQARRLVPEPIEELGPTPIQKRTLPHGSYLLCITAPGHEPVAYPVLIERGEHWNGCPPGEDSPYAIPLPPIGTLDDDEVYVPAGWTWTGGDPMAMDGLPRCRVWIDGFVIGRYPITNTQYLVFLNHLLDSGREAEALAACPRVQTSLSADADELAYGRDANGRFILFESTFGRESLADAPVVLINWHGATAYARFRAERDRRPYRLAHELEREKAARGTDGRLYPWGNQFDATWACVIDSHERQPQRVAVTDYPLDESAYGVRGLAGNVVDWCCNVWTLQGPTIEGGRLQLSLATEDEPARRSIRGGAWTRIAEHSRAAARFSSRPAQGWTTTGMRLVRSYAG